MTEPTLNRDPTITARYRAEDQDLEWPVTVHAFDGDIPLIRHDGRIVRADSLPGYLGVFGLNR